jgi:hypothetical protein
VRPLRAEEELTLRLAGTRARRSGRIDELAARVDWQALLDELSLQRLVPLLGGRLLESADAPPEFAAAVREETDAAREAGTLLELVTLRVATALETAGVANVPLKGPLLARQLHGDPAMRYSRDIDVLVTRADFAPAVEALRGLGWRPETSVNGEPILHLRLLHDEGLPEVELHWRVHWYETEFGARALARAVPGADGVRRLSDVDGLAALLLYHARDGFAGLRHPIDVAAWWDQRAEAGAEPLLAPVVRAHPELAGSLHASAVVLERLVGVPARALVDVAGDLPWGARRAIALANPLMRGAPEQITADVSLVDGLLAPKGCRRDFVRRRVLPSGRDLPSTARRRPLAIARSEHAARLLRRYLIAAARYRQGDVVSSAKDGGYSRRLDQ